MSWRYLFLSCGPRINPRRGNIDHNSASTSNTCLGRAPRPIATSRIESLRLSSLWHLLAKRRYIYAKGSLRSGPRPDYPNTNPCPVRRPFFPAGRPLRTSKPVNANTTMHASQAMLSKAVVGRDERMYLAGARNPRCHKPGGTINHEGGSFGAARRLGPVLPKHFRAEPPPPKAAQFTPPHQKRVRRHPSPQRHTSHELPLKRGRPRPLCWGLEFPHRCHGNASHWRCNRVGPHNNPARRGATRPDPQTAPPPLLGDPWSFFGAILADQLHDQPKTAHLTFSLGQWPLAGQPAPRRHVGIQALRLCLSPPPAAART